MSEEVIVNDKKHTAIVLDGNVKSALSIVRSLGRKGIKVIVGAPRGSAMALHSKYANKTFVYPSAITNQAGFVEAFKKAIFEIGGKPVVYTCSDATFLSLYQIKEEIADQVLFLTPDSDAVSMAFDKAATYSQAGHLGIKTIPTTMLSSATELLKVKEALSYPTVIKTRRSVTYNNGIGVTGTAYFVQNFLQLQELFTTLSQKTGEAPLIQTFIKGEEYGVELLLNQGEVVAETIHHRIRSLSPTGGASVVKETLEEGELTQELRTQAYKLAKALNWSGPLMVEFKVENETRDIYLMELNGRWWGSLPLGIKAGVDFPYWHYILATGGLTQTSVIQAQPYITTRHFLGDVMNLARVWFARDKMRPYLYPRRRKALRDFFRSFNIPGDVWDWRDIKPSLWEYIDVINKKRL
jgi:predicted ATP-grasp superfamily ATP-dependent carboligase